MSEYSMSLQVYKGASQGIPMYEPAAEEAKYSYVYRNSDGNAINYTIPLLHKTSIKINIADNTGNGFKPFGCMVNAAGGGGLVHYFMSSPDPSAVMDVLQSVPNSSSIFTKMSLNGSNEIILDVNQKIVSIMRRVSLTVLLSYETVTTDGEPKYVVMACDPEFDDDREN